MKTDSNVGCFAEELRRLAQVDASAGRYMQAATQLAAAFELLFALVAGTKHWQIIDAAIYNKVAPKDLDLDQHDSEGLHESVSIVSIVNEVS